MLISQDVTDQTRLGRPILGSLLSNAATLKLPPLTAPVEGIPRPQLKAHGSCR